MSRTGQTTEKERLNSAAAADLCRVNRATFNRWVKQGLITPVLVYPGATGGRLFDRADVERLAAERAHAGAA